MSIYNEPEEWLKDSIESILNQTFTDLEFIIVNDNPERLLNSQILNHYKARDNRIIQLDNTENFGLTISLNKVFRKAKGRYIARMDADDISLPKRLEKQFEYMERNPSIGVCGSWVQNFGEINLLSQRINKMPLSPQDVKTTFVFSNPLVHPTTLFRRKSIDLRQDLYDEQCKNAQDYLLWEKLLDQSIQCANVPKVLLRYRVSKEQISNKLKKNQNNVANDIQLRSLKKMDLTLSDIDIDIYLKLLNRSKLSSLESFERAEHILLKIRALMLKDKAFSRQLVEKKVCDEWISGFLNLQSPIRPWRLFYASPLFSLRLCQLRDFARILLTRNR